MDKSKNDHRLIKVKVDEKIVRQEEKHGVGKNYYKV